MHNLALTAALIASSAFAQQLVLKEEWKAPKAPAIVKHPVGQDSLSNPNLNLNLYGDGPDGHGIWLVKHNPPMLADPAHVWTGPCTASCAFTLQDKDNYLDLTGVAKIRYACDVGGFHLLQPIVKLADGTWLVGDHAVGLASDHHKGYHEHEISFAEIRWRKLNMQRLVEDADREWVEYPDLSNVDEIGFADLMQQSDPRPGGWSDVGPIEVYGKTVKRAAVIQSKLN